MKGLKQFKKVVSLLLTVAMMIAMAAPAFAAGETTGSIKIKGTDNVSASEKEFRAYKILDVEFPEAEGANDNHMSYKVPAEMEDFYVSYFSTKGLDKNNASFHQDVVDAIADLRENGAEDQADKNDKLRKFMSAALTYAKETANIQGISGQADGEKDYIISNLPFGYYVVEDVVTGEGNGTDEAVSALILDTTTPNPTVTIKTDKPSIEKKIEKSATEKVDYNDAAIGDHVQYEITSTVPDMTHYTNYKFVVTDRFSKGLSFDDDSLAITVGEKTLVAGTDYELTKPAAADVPGGPHGENSTFIKIVFKNFKNYQTGNVINIRYTATVTKDAEIGAAGNANDAKLQYSNNPNHVGNGDDFDGEEPKGETPWDKVVTFVTGLQLTKIKTGNPDQKLAGAQFKITGEKLNQALVWGSEFVEAKDGETATYYKLIDGSYTLEAPTNNTRDKYEDATAPKYIKKDVSGTDPSNVKEEVNYTAEVDANGVLSLKGLAAGIYTITEVKSPNGYNILKNPIKVEIKCNTEYSSDENPKCSWAWRKSDENGNLPTDDMTGFETLSDEGIVEFNVENSTGVELPSTGGMGTTIFYVLGSILLIGAGILLVTKKKMAGRQ